MSKLETSAYMQMPDVQGEATATSHKNWIPLEAMDFHVNRHIVTKTGRGNNRESSMPEFSEITLTKEVDQSSAKLMQLSYDNKVQNPVKIDLCRTGSNNASAYAEITLANAMVSHYRLSHDAEGKPVEEIRLNFDKIQFKYTPSDNSNQSQGNQTTGFDISEGKIAAA